MMTEIISSVLSGGLTGLLGAAITKFSEYKTKQLDIEQLKLKHLHEAAMKELDASIMQKEYEARMQIAEVEAQALVESEDSRAFAKSYDMEPERYSNPAKSSIAQNWALVVLDFVRGIVRPGLTIYLCLIVTIMYAKASGSAVSEAVAMEIVQTVLYLCTTSILWWFGARGRSK